MGCRTGILQCNVVFNEEGAPQYREDCQTLIVVASLRKRHSVDILAPMWSSNRRMPYLRILDLAGMPPTVYIEEAKVRLTQLWSSRMASSKTSCLGARQGEF